MTPQTATLRTSWQSRRDASPLVTLKPSWRGDAALSNNNCWLVAHCGHAAAHPSKMPDGGTLKAVAGVQAERHAHGYGALRLCITQLSRPPEQLQRQLVVCINALAVLQQQHAPHTSALFNAGYWIQAGCEDSALLR